MALKLYVNTQARSVANALVRSETDLTPVALPELVIGDKTDYELYFADGEGSFASWSGNASYTPYIAIGGCRNPTGGTFTLTYSGQTTSALAYNVSPAALQAALEALSNIAPGDVTVTGVAGIYYKVVFGGALAATNVSEITGNGANLSPESVVSVDTITGGAVGVNEVQLIQLRQNPITFASDWTPITNGWAGQLSTRTLEIVEALVAESPITDTFQITVEDPSANRHTYLKADASILCTVIDPESFAGSDKPTLATTAYVDAKAFASGIATREALSSSATGNINVTRPSGSQRHYAYVTVTGTAGTRTISVLTTNTPVAGYTVRVYFVTPATADIVLEVRNATSGGTLLKPITTDGSGVPYFVDLGYTGSAWQLIGDNGNGMQKAQNLSGLANIATARANIGSQKSIISDKSGDFTVTGVDDGTLFRVTSGGSAVTVTLPSASSVDAGYSIAILKVDSGVGAIVTDPATETITLQNELMELQSDGSGWTVLSRIARQVNASGVLNFFGLTGLTGGGTAKLDGQITEDGRYSVGSVALLTFNDDASEWWKLKSGTNTEDAPSGIVLPDDYNASTNAVYWKRIG